jgi:hypothetical protein
LCRAAALNACANVAPGFKRTSVASACATLVTVEITLTPPDTVAPPVPTRARPSDLSSPELPDSGGSRRQVALLARCPAGRSRRPAWTDALQLVV